MYPWCRSAAIGVTALLSAACGSGASEAVTPLPDCSDVAALVSALDPAIAYDYDPVTSVADLVHLTDVTFRAGVIADVERVGDWLVFTVGEVEVLRDARPGTPPPPTSFSHAVGAAYEYVPQSDTFRGAEVLVAAHVSPDAPDGLQASIEGFFLACGDDIARSVVFTPGGDGWPEQRTIAALTAAVRAATGIQHPIWEESALDCYGELAEAAELEPLMGGDVPGFDSIEAAANQWWTVDDGRFRADREELVALVESDVVRYEDAFGNTQVIIAMTRTGTGGWIAAQTEACFYG